MVPWKLIKSPVNEFTIESKIWRVKVVFNIKDGSTGGAPGNLGNDRRA